MRACSRTEESEAFLRLHRRQLEEIDLALVRLVAFRCQAVAQLWDRKRSEGLALTDPIQERRVLDRARAWGSELGISEEAIERIVASVLEEGKRYAAHDAEGSAAHAHASYLPPPETVVGLSMVFLPRILPRPPSSGARRPRSRGVDERGK